MKKYDLTEGPILKKLLVVAIPIMGTQLIQMAYNMTDMYWLGRLGDKAGSDAVAATGIAGLYTWLIMAFILIGRTGSEIGVSQCIGRKDMEGARKYSQNSLVLSFILSIICAIICIIFSKQLIGFFNIQEANVALDAANYLAVVSLAFPFFFATGSLTGTFNGAGNSKVSFFANLIGLIVNMILDPLLVLFFNLGVVGAAIATAAAQVAVGIIFLIAIKKYKERPFEKYSFLIKLSKNKIQRIFKWSIPVAVENFFFAFLSMLISRFVTAFGAGALSVQNVGSQVESLSWLIGGGFGVALTAFVGQNFGAKKWGRIHKGFKVSAFAMSIWGIIITLILYFAGEILFGLFLSDPELIAMGGNYLRIFSACQFIFCLEAISSGTFRGIGQTIPPSVVSITANAIRVPLAYFLSRTSLGIDGIWWGITIGAMMRGGVIFIWYLIKRRKYPKSDEIEFVAKSLEHQ